MSEIANPIWAQTSSDVSSGRTFLFIHGDFSNGTMSWSRQWSALKDQHRLILVDRRGHGNSPVEPFPYTIRRDAQDIIDTIRRLSPAGVHLVGHSYGAIVALEAACMQPELVESLYLIEPPYLSLLPDDPLVSELIRQTQSLREEAPQLSLERLTERFFQNVIGAEAMEHLRTKPVWSALVHEAERFSRSQFVGEFPGERLNDLHDSIRVTLFSGGRSHPALQRLAQALHDRLPGSRLHTFSAAGHDVQRIGPPFNDELIK